MKFLVALSLFVVAASAAPVIPCAIHGSHVLADPAPLAYTMPQPVQVAVQPQLQYDFPAPVSVAAAPAPVAVAAPAPVVVAKPEIQYDFPAPVSVAAPAPVAVAAPAPVMVAKPEIQYDFPAPVSVPAPAPAPVVAPMPQIQYDFPAPVYAAAQTVAVAAPEPVKVAAPAPVQVAAYSYAAPAIATQIHYAETPVVVGHSTQIMKPALPGGFPGFHVKTMAPSMDELVTKEKVLAPVRTVSEITPQVTVQHPTKVNVQKVAVEVPVPTPVAQPVPVPVAPQYEIHQIHQQRVVPVAAPAVPVAVAAPCPLTGKTF